MKADYTKRFIDSIFNQFIGKTNNEDDYVIPPDFFEILILTHLAPEYFEKLASKKTKKAILIGCISKDFRVETNIFRNSIQFSSKQDCFLHALPTWVHGRELHPLQPPMPLLAARRAQRVKDTLKTLNYSENKQQKCEKLCFLICKSTYIRKVYSLHYTLRWNTYVKKFPLEEENVTKIHYFFFRELQLITVSLLTLGFYMSWSTRFVSLKVCVVFSIFDSVSLFIEVYYYCCHYYYKQRIFSQQ